MSRGRRSTTPIAPSPSPPSAAAVQKLVAWARGETDDLISESIERALAHRSLPERARSLPVGGGVAGDPARPADDLVEIALWAETVGDTQQRTGLLRRAREHQRAHIQQLSRAAGHDYGRMEEGFAGVRKAGADWLYDRLINAERNGWDLTNAALRAEIRRGFGEATRLALALEDDLGSLLRAGDLDGARQLAKTVWLQSGDEDARLRADQAEPEDLERLARVAAAAPHLTDKELANRARSRIPHLLELFGPLSREQLARMSDGRTDPVAFERSRLAEAPRLLFHPGLRRSARSAPDALLLAQARLRRVRIQHSLEGGQEGDGLRVRVPVHPDVLAHLAADEGGQPVALTCESDRADLGVRVASALLPRVWDGPEGPVEFAFTATLARGDFPLPELHELARRRLTEEGLRVEDPEEPLRRAPADWEVADAPTGRPITLEPARCDHADAHWVASRNSFRLSCDACGRDHVAVIPRHRLPDTEIADAEAYLREERLQAALRGDSRPILSIAQLRRRDGVASKDPRDYAIGFGAAPPRAPRASSLASVFGRGQQGPGTPREGGGPGPAHV